MTPPAHQHDGPYLLSLREVAAELGVTRAAVNFMVRDERLAAERWDARWYVCTEILDALGNPTCSRSYGLSSKTGARPESMSRARS